LITEKNILPALLEPEYVFGNEKLILGSGVESVDPGLSMIVNVSVMTVGFKKKDGRSSPYKNTVLVIVRLWGMAVVTVVVVPVPEIDVILFSAPNCVSVGGLLMILPSSSTNEKNT
jgi:hypothetical protein